MKVYCAVIPAANGYGGGSLLDNIAIGNTGAVQLTPDNPLQLQHFGFQKQPFNLEYRWGVGHSAQVTKNGDSYKVSGPATGYQGTTAVTKSFEVDGT